MTNYDLFPCTPPATEGVFRPIQYLGSKVRVMDRIVDVIGSMVGRHATVADLFSGTSVVSQALAATGHGVVSVDVHRYATIMAKACLGVGFKSNSEFINHAKVISEEVDETLVDGEWHNLAVREQALIGSRDVRGLSALYESLPLIWRKQNNALFYSLSRGEVPSNASTPPLVTAIYSGTYFGINQALQIDGIRRSIASYEAVGEIDDWEKAALLTALMSACSAAVHSAGKHFAQPIQSVASRHNAFRAGRLITDRSVDVRSAFLKACTKVQAAACRCQGMNSVLTMEAEQYVPTASGIDAMYADPPYTAQQYSRFYHVLDVICDYKFPQLVGDAPLTKGLYPANRYRSQFCSKRKAPMAFEQLVGGARSQGVPLILSYSASASQSTGNSRAISLEQLLSVCRDKFGRNVTYFELNHRYRQFNSSVNSNRHRNDPEYLIICES